MIQFEENVRHEQVKQVAKQMLMAARTAPKARGQDHLILAVVDGDTIDVIAEQLRKKHQAMPEDFLLRDAENILHASCIVLLGVENVPLGLNCGYCGFATCGDKIKQAPNTPCAFNVHDLGIALGSAVSTAAQYHIDNRVMYSVGAAAMELGLLGKRCICAFGVPLSCTGKNPFFDRPNPYIAKSTK